jgi:hypothetical protein
MNFLRFRNHFLGVGAGASLLLLMGLWSDRAQFFHSYLVAFLFWAGIALGCLSFLLLHHLTGGGWGFAIRHILQSGSGTFLFLALLFLPVILGAQDLYLWANPEKVQADEILRSKAAYLNLPFFVLRSAFYFSVWAALAFIVTRLVRRLELKPDARIVHQLRGWSGAGLLLYALTVTFSSVDWAMSIEPHWYSTMYGILFMIGQALSGLALVLVLLLLFLPEDSPLHADHLHDLGNLLFAFVMLWAYVSFSQFLIIWSGNLPEEIPWYLRRSRGGWVILPTILAAFHFALPLVLLLSRTVKRRRKTLLAVSLWLLFMRFADVYWMVMPAYREKLGGHWMDLAAFLALGGLWLGLVFHRLNEKPLLHYYQARTVS